MLILLNNKPPKTLKGKGTIKVIKLTTDDRDDTLRVVACFNASVVYIPLTNQNSIQEEIKSRSKSGNVCNHSVQDLLCSRLLFKNLKIKIYRTINLSVVLYGCETWSLTLREDRRLRVFENRLLRRIFGPKRDEVTGEWRKLHNEELHDLYSSATLVRVIKWRMRWTEHVVRMGEGRFVCWVWWEILREKDNWGDPGVSGGIILGRIFRKWDVGYGLDLAGSR
jgi:PAS domain-containing protein